MEEYKASFVILHYVDFDMTVRCVDTILKGMRYDNYSVVIVDNGSPNESGKRLERYYAGEPRVEVVVSEENLGFAKGNNIGYLAAKGKHRADFIVVANNDVLFPEGDFLTKVIGLQKACPCHVLGPDVLTPGNTHQNPFRAKPMERRDVKIKLRNRRIFGLYYQVKRCFRLENRIRILEQRFEGRNEQQMQRKEWQKARRGAVLHGSCVIYTPSYVEKEDQAFLPLTFMSGEEDLLANYCRQRGYEMYYSPELQVVHLGGYTTRKVQDAAERVLFRNKHLLHGMEQLLKEMDTGRR